MNAFQKSKDYLISKGVYKNAIFTDHTNQTIYITIPYGAIKNAGISKVYKRSSLLYLNRIVSYWFNSVDSEKVYTY